MSDFFTARIPDREIFQLPSEWFHIASGPVFGRVPVKAGDHDLIRYDTDGQGPLGEHILLRGRVVDSDGRGVPDTLIEIWQANSAGRYIDVLGERPHQPIDPNFVGAGRCITDSQGRYAFRTIKPAAYPGPPGTPVWRSAHVHFSLFGPKVTNRLITQCYFEHDPLHASDFVYAQTFPEARDLLVARCDPSATMIDEKQNLVLTYNWDIVLRGPSTTPMEA
jgi:protocatechuate 3,4-dioxygenase beta subunit